jgi:hypothetical protein
MNRTRSGYKETKKDRTDFRSAKNSHETLTLTKREWGTLPGSLLAAGVLPPRGKERPPSAVGHRSAELKARRRNSERGAYRHRRTAH